MLGKAASNTSWSWQYTSVVLDIRVAKVITSCSEAGQSKSARSYLENKVKQKWLGCDSSSRVLS
jgi:hypothetical protein